MRRRGRNRRRAARLAGGLSSGGLLWAAASWLGARALSERLLSPTGLGATPQRHDAMLASLAACAAGAEQLRHDGSARLPASLWSAFAAPGPPAARPTILFLHGKGGNASEWEPDAVRALSLGYNVLVPDLRGHGRSGGKIFTLGLLEKEDLALLLSAARERFGIDSERLGVHSCSAGSAVALEFAAGRPGVRAIWLESPFADPREMARHYLSKATGLPAPLLALTARWAVARAVTRVKRELGLEGQPGGAERLDPLRAIARVTAPVFLVRGGEDRLTPPRFAHRLAGALPPGSETWDAAGAGHCHHENEPARVRRDEYVSRWSAFFAKHLPVL